MRRRMVAVVVVRSEESSCWPSLYTTSRVTKGDPLLLVFLVLTHVHQGPATMAVTSLDESERYLAASSAMGSVAQSYSVVVKGQEV